MIITLLGDVWLVGPKQVNLPPFSLEPARLCVANLETPLIPELAVLRPKSGPHLESNKNALSVFPREFSHICMALANNHAMDYGEQGLIETQSRCQDLGICTVGAGMNIDEARAPVVREIDGIGIGVISRCERQFGVATNWRAGVAPLDPTIYASIGQLAAEVDVVLVSVHGAAELSAWPSPDWQDLLRSLVDAGATLVHGHHSHVPQGYEKYGDGIIFYGLGNFLVDPVEWSHRHNPHTRWSIVADCYVGGSGLDHEIRTVVIERVESDVTVRWSAEVELDNHMKYLATCNKPLSDRELLAAVWQESAVRMYELLFAEPLGYHPARNMRGRNGILKGLSTMRRTLRSALNASRPISQDHQLFWYHAFSCESHRNVVSTALGVISGEVEDMRTDGTKRIVDEMMPWSADSNPEFVWPHQVREGAPIE